MKKVQVLVIGGGPAGLLAAGRAADMGASVLLLEKNKMVGRKLRITGKGRCNITNAGDIRQFIEQYPEQGPFLYSAYSRFFNEDLSNLLESQGVKLKTERGNRIFPESDDANQVANALADFATEAGVRIWTGTEVNKVIYQDTTNGKQVSSVEIKTKKGLEQISVETVIIATGGLSYPLTGSTGDGYKWAKDAGHLIKDLRPGLVPLESMEAWVSELSGLALKNVEASLWSGPKENSKCLDRIQGELLFTHFGVTGPIILSISRSYQKNLSQPVILRIDLKPALSEEVLDKRLQRDFEKYQKKQLKNSLNDLMPRALVPIIIQIAKLDGDIFINQITKKERKQIVDAIKGITLTIKDTRPMAEAIITIGGVALNEIAPQTMGSKMVNGLYFAGEVLDIDGYTGGYNLQAAFSTGWVSGEAAATYAINPKR